jgi:hypothetical protein
MNRSYAFDENDLNYLELIDFLRSECSVTTTNHSTKWTAALARVPSELKSVLLQELLSKNTVTAIQDANWPQEGSIVICLGFRLKNKNPENSTAVQHRILNDPKYWYEEVAQIFNGIEHIIITR